jgi:hypothetical protein
MISFLSASSTKLFPGLDIYHQVRTTSDSSVMPPSRSQHSPEAAAPTKPKQRRLHLGLYPPSNTSLTLHRGPGRTPSGPRSPETTPTPARRPASTSPPTPRLYYCPNTNVRSTDSILSLHHLRTNKTQWRPPRTPRAPPTTPST